jgi:hypothetical protein
MSTISLTFTNSSSVTPANGKNTVTILGNLNGYATAQVRDHVRNKAKLTANQISAELYVRLQAHFNGIILPCYQPNQPKNITCYRNWLSDSLKDELAYISSHPVTPANGKLTLAHMPIVGPQIK